MGSCVAGEAPKIHDDTSDEVSMLAVSKSIIAKARPQDLSEESHDPLEKPDGDFLEEEGDEKQKKESGKGQACRRRRNCPVKVVATPYLWNCVRRRGEGKCTYRRRGSGCDMRNRGNGNAWECLNEN